MYIDLRKYEVLIWTVIFAVGLPLTVALGIDIALWVKEVLQRFGVGNW